MYIYKKIGEGPIKFGKHIVFFYICPFGIDHLKYDSLATHLYDVSIISYIYFFFKKKHTFAFAKCTY